MVVLLVTSLNIVDGYIAFETYVYFQILLDIVCDAMKVMKPITWIS